MVWSRDILAKTKGLNSETGRRIGGLRKFQVYFSPFRCQYRLFNFRLYLHTSAVAYFKSYDPAKMRQLDAVLGRTLDVKLRIRGASG